MIGIVTDSSAQLPALFADLPNVRVLPIRVSVGGTEFNDGVDLDHSWFHTQLSDGVEISTSQPSPGEFAECYRSLLDSGVSEIVSVHVSGESSGTVNAARLGAELVDAPIRIVDTGLVSFGVACCVIEAVRLRDAGMNCEAIQRGVVAFAPTVASSFLIQAADFVRDAGRSPITLPESHDGVMVFGGVGSAIDLVGTGREVEELAAQLVESLLSSGGQLFVGVGEGDPSTLPFAEAMIARLAADDRAAEVVRYTVNPSVMAYSGLGCAGGYAFPIR